MPPNPAEPSRLSLLVKLASPQRRHPDWRKSMLGAGALLLQIAGVVLLAGVGAIHLHLWLAGYRAIPTIGNLFLANVVGAFVTAGGLLVWPSRLCALAGTGLSLGTLLGLVLSINVGLFGFRETMAAPFAGVSVAVEVAATAVLLAWLSVDLLAGTRAGTSIRAEGR